MHRVSERFFWFFDLRLRVKSSLVFWRMCKGFGFRILGLSHGLYTSRRVSKMGLGGYGFGGVTIELRVFCCGPGT